MQEHAQRVDVGVGAPMAPPWNCSGAMARAVPSRWPAMVSLGRLGVQQLGDAEVEQFTASVSSTTRMLLALSARR